MSSKAPGIRETVKILLALFADCGCPHIPSESFRQAKFNKPEAVEPFLKVLQHVLRVLHFLKSSDARDIREAITVTTHNSSDEVVHRVRKCALELGYHRMEFYIGGVSSCELLLFFAWLFQATSFISQLRSYHLSAALSNMSIPLASSKQFLLERVEKNITSLDREIQTLALDSHAMSLDNALRKIQWMKGVLKGDCRSVQNSHRAAVKLSHTILQSCTGSASQTRRQPLSLHDLFLLRYPEQQSACVKRLEWHTASLHNLLQWQWYEPVFWQWMESVLDQYTVVVLTDTSNRETRDTSDTELVATELCVEKISEEVVKCQQRLSRRLDDKKLCIEQLRKAWKSKERANLRSEKPLGNLKLELHLSLQRVAIESGMWCPVPVPEPSNRVLHNSLKYRAVECELCRLQASIDESEKRLQSLMSAVVEFIQ